MFCLFALAKINISSQQKNIFPENFKNVFGEESKYYEINRTLISNSYNPVNVPSSLVHMPTFGVNLIGVALMILDEPSTYIDKRFEARLYELLAEINKDCAIILVSHDIGNLIVK